MRGLARRSLQWGPGVLAGVLLIFPVGRVSAQEGHDRPLSKDELHRILDGLERGMDSLERLGCREEMAVIGRVADWVRREIRQDEGERRRAEEREREAARSRMREEPPHHPEAEGQRIRQELEIMETAKPILREEGRKGELEILEHAMHARKLGLEGRTDPEAARIRETAPDLGAEVEALRLSADLWDKIGHETKAKALRNLADGMWERREHPEQDRPVGEAHPGLERLARRIHELESSIEELREQVRALRQPHHF